MPYFESNGLRLHYRESGAGLPFFFQHGLGGDLEQTFGIFRPPAGIRMITFDCRGHGKSPLGPEDELRFDTFANDLRALWNHLGVSRAVVGGISMGAGVALNFALRQPEAVEGLVLSRPAWLDTPNPWNTRVFPWIAGLIQDHGVVEGRNRYRTSREFAEMQAEFPDVAASLDRQFSNPRAAEVAVALGAIPPDVPNRHRHQWSELRVPTLVLANRRDPVHPFEYGEILASAIPGAKLREVTSKSEDLQTHEREVQAALEEFLAAIDRPRP